MYQVGTRQVPWQLLYIYVYRRVLTLVRIPFTLPYLTDLLGMYLGGREARRGKTKKGYTYVIMNGFFFFRDKMR